MQDIWVYVLEHCAAPDAVSLIRAMPVLVRALAEDLSRCGAGMKVSWREDVDDVDITAHLRFYANTSGCRWEATVDAEDLFLAENGREMYQKVKYSQGFGCPVGVEVILRLSGATLIAYLKALGRHLQLRV